MARVYKAYQASLDRYVALKVLHSHLAEDPDFVNRFEREATAVARLRHPNIVQVFDYDVQDDLYYIVMEFVEGPTLKAEITQRLKNRDYQYGYVFDQDEVVRLFATLSDAIEYAHIRGMIHRDLKPGNIMFTAEGQIMLTDFGLARMVFSSSRSLSGALSGTPAYMAPEQVEGGAVDERADIYSLGIVLYELFSGRVPFEADTPYELMTKHVTDEVPPIREFNPDIPTDAETVILKALSKNSESRYQSAEAFSSALQDATGVIVVQTSASGLVAPIATLADSQELVPVTGHTGVSEFTLAALTSPYRGLYAFREEDSPYFFGRETFTERLSETLNEQSMVAVIGPSGSGKSSVVYAGLLPKLRGLGNWTIIHMRPGSEPFFSLANALIETIGSDDEPLSSPPGTQEIAEALRNGQSRLSELLGQAHKDGDDQSRHLLVVDQFEELYTLCLDEDVRHQFPTTLFEAVNSDQSQKVPSFSLVLTLRADFMGQALADRPFADALQDADVKLGPMTRAELGRAIESPAAKKHVVFEAGLVDRILDDVGDEPGNLPLLEFALTLLWEKRAGRRLTHAAYESIGRVEGSLARYADEVYEQLSISEREMARRVFTQMVRPGEGTEDTRRLATRDELGEADWALAQRLAAARLVTTGRSPSGQETVEVVHEALIRGWQQLRIWMNSERAFRSWQERLRVAVRQWEDNRRDEGALLRGAPLAEAEEWLNSKNNELSDAERRFIKASINQRERQAEEREAQRRRELAAAKKLAEEQQRLAEAEFQRAEEQARSTKRLRLLAVVLAAVFLLAVAAAIVAIGQSQDASQQANARATEVVIRSAAEAQAMVSAELAATRAFESTQARDIAEVERARANQSAEQAIAAKDEAENERDRADNQARLAFARQLAAQSTILQGPQLDLALLLSLEAYRIDESVETASSILSALQVNPNLETYLRGHPSLLQSVAFSPDGNLLATAGAEGLVLLWDISTKEIIGQFSGHDPTQLVNRVTFSPDGKTLATASDDTSVILWDIESREIDTVLESHQAWVQSVDFSPDGHRLVTGSGDRTVIVWDVETGEPILNMSGHTGPVWDAVFSNDGTLIASASGDNNVRIWDSLSGELVRTLSGHTGPVFGVSFDPSDESLVSSSADFSLILWDVDSGDPIGEPMIGHVAGAVDVEISPDGEVIASSGADSTVRLWDVASQQQQLVFGNHNGLVPAVTFSPDGLMLASGDATGTAILWDIQSNLQPLGTVLTGHNGAVNDLSVHPDGELLATAGADSTIRFWDMDMKVQTEEPITHGQRISEPVISMSFSEDGSILATGSRNGTAMFWDTTTGENITPTISAQTNGITAMDLSNDGSILYTGNPAGFTALWDVNSGNQIGPFLSGHSGLVTAVLISPDGLTAASAGANGSLLIRPIADIPTGPAAGTPIQPLTGTQSVDISILSLAFSPDSSQLLTGDNKGNIALWDSIEQEVLEQVNIPGVGPLVVLAYSPEGNLIAVGGANGDVLLLESETLNETLRFPQLHETAITTIAFADDGQNLITIDESGIMNDWDIGEKELTSSKRLPVGLDPRVVNLNLVGGIFAVGDADGQIQLISLDIGEHILAPMIHATPFIGNVAAVEYSPDGKTFATAGADGAIVLWDADSLQAIGRPFLGHSAAVVNLAFSPDGKKLASGSCAEFHSAGSCIGGEVILWDLESRQIERVLTGTVGFSQAIAFSPDGSTLVVNDCQRVEVAGACIEGTLQLYEVKTGLEIGIEFLGHTGFVWSADFSPDGNLIASGSADNSIIIWDVETGQPVGQRLSNHGGPVRRVAFNSDGKQLASAGLDNLVYLWDVGSGQAIGGPIALYANNAMDVAFDPEGSHLVSSSVDGTITISDVELDSWIDRACDITNRNMRPEEWDLFFDQQSFRETCPEN